MRQSKLESAMAVAETISKRSHDPDTQVGCVLIKNSTGAIIATGYNGFIRGAPDSKLPTERPEKYQYIVHAEMNMIANCARLGISMDDCTLVSTLSPCISCTRMLWQCGITDIITDALYKDYPELDNMDDITILKTTTKEGFYRLKYQAKEEDAGDEES